MNNTTNLDFPFKVENARSDRSKCNGWACGRNIGKNELRVANVVQSKGFDGREEHWLHFICFFEENKESITSVLQFDGFSKLRYEDQERLKDLIGPIKRKRNANEGDDENAPEQKKIKGKDALDMTTGKGPFKQQNKEFFELHDFLKNDKSKKDWIKILEENNQAIPKGVPEKIFHTADVIFYGALPFCDHCKKGQLMFYNYAYKCNGHTKWGSCNNIVEVPKRRVAVIPESLRNKHANLFGEYAGTRTRLLNFDLETELQQIRKVEPGTNNNSSIILPKKQMLKRGNVADPECGYANLTHVYSDGKLDYNVHLTKVDVTQNPSRNSYYIIKLLESDGDGDKQYWIVRKYGRTGTDIGDSKLDPCTDLDDAICRFCVEFNDKTENNFGEKFEKRPGMYNLLDMDYSENVKIAENTVDSKLPQSVQNLVHLLFDKYTMNHMILEFDLDMAKMPLGKLSQAQLKKATEVLERISRSINSEYPDNRLLDDASNEFYALVPHVVGLDNLPIINSKEMLEKKIEMIESLKNIELTFKLLDKVNGDDVNPIDFNYRHLKAVIESLIHDSEEFKLLAKYVENTHAKMHDGFELIVEDIFKVTRDDEVSRFEPFAQKTNRQLLFHGSRLTNYVSILSKGLQIAPPEAPVSGYMFGKGVYFADMVSKSANYCRANKTDNTGLVLLCQVALGKTQGCYAGDSNIKLHQGYDSVKGIGKTYPNPDESYIRGDGVKIPLGKPIVESTIHSDLFHHEYIVYDVGQVKIEYLLKLKFIFKKLFSP